MRIGDIKTFFVVIRLQSLNQAADALQLTRLALTRCMQNAVRRVGGQNYDNVCDLQEACRLPRRKPERRGQSSTMAASLIRPSAKP